MGRASPTKASDGSHCRHGGVGSRQQASASIPEVKVGFTHTLSLRLRPPSYLLWQGTRLMHAIQSRGLHRAQTCSAEPLSPREAVTLTG